MNSEPFIENLDLISKTFFGINKFRKRILQLALQGKLVRQNPNDETANKLKENLKKDKVLIGEADETSDFLPINKNDMPYELPQSWEWVRLGEIGITNIGLTYSPRDISSTGVPVLRSMNIKNGKVVFDELVRVDKEIKKKLMVQVGDVIICARNGSKALVGKSAQIKTLPEPMSFGAFMAIFRCKCNPYIEIFLNSNLFRGQLDDANTTTINQLTQYMLKNQLIPLPPLEEQKRIVAKVDQLMALCDELEAKQEKQTQTRRQLNDAALNALLSATSPDEFEKHWQRIVDNFDLLYDDLENLQSLRQAILDLAFNDTRSEKGLAQTSIGEMLIDIKYGTSKRCGPEVKGVPVLRIPNVVKGLLNIDELKYGRLEKSEYENLKLKEGDILIIRSNGSLSLVGKTAIVTKEYENYAYAGYLIRLRFDLNQILPEYVRYWFSTAVIRKIIEGQASSTSGVNNINTKKIESLPFKLIPLKEQIRVVAKVDQLLALCDELEKKLTAKSYLADSISF